MKIEAGKFYKTRSGVKAYVAGRLLQPRAIGRFKIWHGDILSDTGWSYHTWEKDGSDSEGALLPLDLVSEWRELISGKGFHVKDKRNGSTWLVKENETSYFLNKSDLYEITDITYQERRQS